MKTAMNIEETAADLHQRIHPGCIVCGFTNSKGLHLHFDVHQDGSVSAAFDCDRSLEGYPGVLHGGVISTVLDGAMGHCMFARQQTAVTVEMNTRFRHPVEIGQPATVTAHIKRIAHPLYLLEATIIQNGQVKATAKGKFYDQPELLNVLERHQSKQAGGFQE